MSNDFFNMVAEAAFSNPFGEQRKAIDRRITGASESADWDEMMPALLKQLGTHLDQLKDTGQIHVDRDEDEDARTLATSILFYVFHEYILRFDALIEEQIRVGDQSCRAPFALECMNRLIEYGFQRSEACRYVGIFYQIRRAYYFISHGLIGESSCMKRFREQLWDNIFTHDIAWYEQCLWNRMEDFSTLLLGETGTGKGAAAAAIGRSGFIPFDLKTQRFEESFTRAFVSINLSQYPESLMESELFGHRKGAFTGAVEKHDGLFARCSRHGAIFLDEIGDVSVPVQIKLLQVLQERTFSPVGSHEHLRFSGRVIAATNRPIDTLRKEGRFRDDFYYRLCSDIITVPPLRDRIRERPGELDRLAKHLTGRICGPEPRLPVVELLREGVGKNYAWPGNVRELEQAIRRVLIAGGYKGDAKDCDTAEVTTKQAFHDGDLTARELVEVYCIELHDRYGSYGEVARRTGLDWRTVKKHVQKHSA